MLLFAFVSCTPSDADSGGGESDAITVEILSPDHGEKFDKGDNIHFEVSVKAGQADAKTESVVWTIGREELRGAEADFSRLDPGSHDVEVEVTVDGKTYSDDIGITVRDAGGDADTDTDTDTDTDVDVDVQYSGSLTTHIWLEGDFDYDDDCNGTVSITFTASDTLVGTGQCRLGDYDFPYTIDGVGNRGNLSGDMILTSEGVEYMTPFTGTGERSSPINASFDKTFRDGGNSIRIQGSWSATPI